MSLLEKLQKKSDDRFKELLDEFVEEVTKGIESSAEEGYKGYRMRIDDAEGDRAILFGNTKLLSELEKHFEGFEIFIDNKEYSYLMFPEQKFYKRYLVIRW